MSAQRSRIATLAALTISALALTTTAAAEPTFVDECESLDGWRVAPSDGVEAKVSLDDGVEGHALRLDFDFTRGSGFVVLRRELPMDLPANYRFRYELRGDAPANNLEFKLIAESDEDVWWVNRRAYRLPHEWQQNTHKKRHIQFAWGPSAGAPLQRIRAIEFAVAAAEGGKGSLWIDRLTFEPLPEPQPVTHQPRVSFSSSSDGASAGEAAEMPESGEVTWHSAAADASPVITLDFLQFRVFGGLAIDWDDADYATAYDVATSVDGQSWRTEATIANGTGRRDWVPMPDAEAAFVRIKVKKDARGRGVGLKGLRVLDVSFADSPNNMYATIAREAPRGWYPRPFLGEAQPWTVVGVDRDEDEALIDVAGAIEVDRRSFRIEPFLYVDGTLVTWADAACEQRLVEGYLPIPKVVWRSDDLALEILALADGVAGESRLLTRYTVTNTGSENHSGALLLALRPFQVLPPWQSLNMIGGACDVSRIALEDGRIVVDAEVGRKTVRPWTAPDAFGAGGFAQGDLVEYLTRGAVPSAKLIDDPWRRASAVLRYDFALGPGGQRTVVLETPYHENQSGTSEPASDAVSNRDFDEVLLDESLSWAWDLNLVQLELPPSAARIADTFRSTQAYIMINADGVKIQPGSRTYERSWIRDSAMTGTALLNTGHTERVREYIDWYAGYLYPDGKVPCVVDHRGPDPVAEHDSTGEFIYLLAEYYRYTHDRDILERHFDSVVAGVGYLERLRAQRMTPEFRDGPPDKRVLYGLVPESISHEGYSAKPMHSYWDGFWVIRGFKDAAEIAGVLGRTDEQQRFAKLRDEYRQSMYDSIRLAMKTNNIDYIPGCAELGDFDATSTAVGVFPCGELGQAPEPALHNTFERYYEFFKNRRDGKLEWRDYTPYEIRLVGTFVRLGRPDRAHELLDFFMGHQRPPGWNHWAEVVWRDPQTPGFIGDMPHTWVGSAFVNAVRSMFVDEREEDESLVLAAGVREAWLSEGEGEGRGVKIGNFPTEYGAVSYTLRDDGDQTVLELSGDLTRPPGGIVIRNPRSKPVKSATVDGVVVAGTSADEVRLNATQGRIVISY